MTRWTWRLADTTLTFDRPLLMGIVNTTPDSFSDGGRFLDPTAAIGHGLRLLDEGADLLDVGGESTRPGAHPVPAEEEERRVLPVIEALAARGAVVSVDTSKAAVARSALEAGASIVNDVMGLRGDAMRSLVSQSGAGAVIMHMQGTPSSMQSDPTYDDVVHDVRDFLEERVSEAIAAGCAPESIVIDPGIGFGKTIEHNLALCNRLGAFASLGRPILIGTSRKGFLGALTGHTAPDERDLATAITMALAIERGAAVLRVHDVATTGEALSVALAIVEERQVDVSHGLDRH